MNIDSSPCSVKMPYSASSGLTNESYVRNVRPRRATAWYPAISLLYVFLALLGQHIDHAVAAGFGNYPDEPAHYLSSLMLHDYFLWGMKQPPIDYAANYYMHLPFVAIGHWPPIFYIVQAVWMLAFGYTRAHVLVFIALITAATSMTIYVATRNTLGNFGALMLGVLLQTVPIIRWSNDVVMNDIFVALLILWATLALGCFLNTEKNSHALYFGVLASIALLAKPSAACLALLPLPAILLLGKYHLLKRLALWTAGILVVATVVPWYAATWHLSTYGHVSMVAGLRSALPSCSIGIAKQVNIFLLLFLAGVYDYIRTRKQDGGRIVLILLPVATVVALAFSSIEIEPRHLIPAILAIIIISADGIVCLFRILTKEGSIPNWRINTAIVLLAVICVFMTPKRQKLGLPDRGLNVMISQIQASTSDQSKVVLVAGRDASTEGRFIATAAANMQFRPPVTFYWRATKVLAQSNWDGSSYVCLVDTPEAVIKELDQDGINLIAIDRLGMSNQLRPHETLLLDAIRQHPERFQQIYADQDSGDGLYRFSPKYEAAIPKIMLRELKTKLEFNPLSYFKQSDGKN